MFYKAVLGPGFFAFSAIGPLAAIGFCNTTLMLTETLRDSSGVKYLAAGNLVI